ncbi:UNVERIFIED_CONTAM: Eif2s2 [Trichonephila clavipes]
MEIWRISKIRSRLCSELQSLLPTVLVLLRSRTVINNHLKGPKITLTFLKEGKVSSLSMAMEGNAQIDLQDYPPELFEFVGQKKKKKTVKFPVFDADSFKAIEETNTEVSEAPAESSPPVKQLDIEHDLSFQQLKKKKKKKRNTEDFLSSVNENIASTVEVDTLPVISNDNNADYTYDDLLTRVFDIMREKDPNRDTETRKKLVMKPPQILRIGTKKSSFVNFLETCKLLHRIPQHVQSFLLVELGTSGSVDGNNQLIIKGRFEQRQIENVLRRYIKEYVTCHTCHSPDTILQKDTRLFFLQCEACGSRCSVASIKSGFQAVTGKRAAIRAKAT